MNTKQLIISNAILAIAVAILFILHFSGDSKESASIEGQKSNSIADNNLDQVTDLETNNNTGLISTNTGFSNLKIAFVNSDTLAKYYTLQKELKDELLKKQSKAESQIKKNMTNTKNWFQNINKQLK